MLRTQPVRRAGRLLGAVVATGVLSTVLLSAGPLAADAAVKSNANSIRVSVQHDDLLVTATQDDANGI
jgi:hypothetical protein